MTAKDAVKCKTLLHKDNGRQLNQHNTYYLPVSAQLPNEFLAALLAKTV